MTGLFAPLIKRIPLTSSIIYLAVGIFIGPTALGLFHFNPLEQSALLELLTEFAVLISLFSAGVKMPMPIRIRIWRAPILLAFLSMSIGVGLVTLFGIYVLGLSIGAAVLLGAIVAPTDPVLATDVQVRHPGDRDRLRFTLTCEAGMNDGSAFPFVMLGLGLLGLHELGELGLRWILVDVLWSTTISILIGVAAGTLLARSVANRNRVEPYPGILYDFLGLGLICTVYGASLLVDGWGFLAVFFAAVSIRQSEQNLPARAPKTKNSSQPNDVKNQAALPESGQLVSEGSLVFKEHLERLSELVLVLLIGGMLFIDSWSMRAVGFAMFLFLVARPISVAVGLIGSKTPWRMRGMVGWFGVRGIGSLYYLMYAIQHGLPDDLALELIHLVLVVVTLSILIHGFTAKPAMSWFWYRRKKQ